MSANDELQADYAGVWDQLDAKAAQGGSGGIAEMELLNARLQAGTPQPEWLRGEGGMVLMENVIEFQIDRKRGERPGWYVKATVLANTENEYQTRSFEIATRLPDEAAAQAHLDAIMAQLPCLDGRVKP